MDLPLLRDSDDGFSPYVAAAASPWGGIAVMDSANGSDFALDTTLAVRATLGETIQPLSAGPSEYWDEGSVLEVKLYAGELASATTDAILSGGTNSFALGTRDGDWEIVQFAECGGRITPGEWERRRSLRLRFVYRRTGPSLLVAEGRLNTKGQAVVSRSKTGHSKGSSNRNRSGGSIAAKNAPIFLLVPQVKLPKWLDLARDADRALDRVPGLIVANWVEARL